MRALGKTVALSVDGSSHAAVTVGADIQDNVSKAAFYNSGATVVAVRMSGGDITCPAATFPTDGTPSAVNELILPATMREPIVFDTPKTPFSLTAIGSAAGPSIIYVTPCE